MKNQKKLQANKELLKFFKKAKKEFKGAKKIDIDGEVLDRQYGGLCSFLTCNGEDILKQDFDSQYDKVAEAIRKELDRVNHSKKYEPSRYGYFSWFPTNEVRLNLIDKQIKKYQKMVDKQ